MSTRIRFLITIAVGLLFCCPACSTTSHIIVGKTRPSTKPEDVKLYLKPPKNYEQIAIVDSDSNASLRFSAQGKVDAAINRAKTEAAKLGANGILFQGMGEKGDVMIGTGTAYGSGNVATGTTVGVSGGGLIKSFTGLAIYVIEE